MLGRGVESNPSTISGDITAQRDQPGDNVSPGVPKAAPSPCQHRCVSTQSRLPASTMSRPETGYVCTRFLSMSAVNARCQLRGKLEAEPPLYIWCGWRGAQYQCYTGETEGVVSAKRSGPGDHSHPGELKARRPLCQHECVCTQSRLPASTMSLLQPSHTPSTFKVAVHFLAGITRVWCHLWGLPTFRCVDVSACTGVCVCRRLSGPGLPLRRDRP